MSNEVIYTAITDKQLLLLMDEFLCLQFQVEAGLATGVDDRLTDEQILAEPNDSFWEALFNYVGDEQ